MELFTGTGKLKKSFWQLQIFDVCTMGDTAHIDTIFQFSPQELEYLIDVCHVTRDAHIEHLWLSKKKKLFQFSCGCEKFH